MAAGIVGYISGSTLEINNCYNTGIIESTKKKDAIVGNTYSPINNCYNLNGCIDKIKNTEVIQIDESKMKSNEFVEELNENIKSIEDNEDFTNWKYEESQFPQLDI